MIRWYGKIAQELYGYKVALLDLRNPTRSHGFNLLHLVNKYTDAWKQNPKDIASKARAEKYAKIIAKTIVFSDGDSSASHGQNAFFYDAAEGLLTSARSRRISIVAIIQSYQQLEKNYEHAGCAVICDNCQLTIAGGFAPGSESAERISKSMGSRTVMSGTITKGKDSASQQLQMTERPLLSADELKSMRKGSFIVLKTGAHPFVSKLKLFFKWGIQLDEADPYVIESHAAREVKYADKAKIEAAIIEKYPDIVVPEPEQPRKKTQMRA